MSRAGARGPTVLVTDAGRGSAVAIIRSLGRSGYRVVAADSEPGALGFHSRYTCCAAVYPSPRTAPEAFCAALHTLVAAEDVGLIIPVTDLSAQPLAAARQRFAPVRLAIPPDEALQVVTDKARTLELAARLGVPTPRTRLVHTVSEALAAGAAWGWPLVLKPQVSHKLESGQGIESFQVTYAESPADLEQKMARFEGRCGVLLQRYFAGVGHGVELLMSRGRPLAAFQHQRRREIPLSGGASSYRESVRLDPMLYGYAERLLAALEWTGLAMVEFKVADGRVALMEINGRVWGSLPLAVASGMDFPARLARLHFAGEPRSPARVDSDYRIGVRCRDLQRDLLWIAAVLGGKRRYDFLHAPSRRRAVRALLGILDPRRKQDLLVWDDPLPGLFELPRLGPRLWGKVRTGTPAHALGAGSTIRMG